MNEEVQLYFDVAEESMNHAAHHLEEALVHIRAGKANTRILDAVRVNYYGSSVPIANVANISTPDAKTIAIQPWEKNMIKEIEKAIMNSEVGITPDNNGEVIRLSIPPLTEDRRKQLVKQVRTEGEEARISVRNARHEAMTAFKKLVKDGLPEDVGKDAEDDVQKLHDRFMKRIDDILAVKEKEILTV
jgi:ribosome recycling factor